MLEKSSPSSSPISSSSTTTTPLISLPLPRKPEITSRRSRKPLGNPSLSALIAGTLNTMSILSGLTGIKLTLTAPCIACSSLVIPRLTLGKPLTSGGRRTISSKSLRRTYISTSSSKESSARTGSPRGNGLNTLSIWGPLRRNPDGSMFTADYKMLSGKEKLSFNTWFSIKSA